MQTLIQATATHIPVPDGWFHACITSPPYWGLRAYAGIEPTEWPPVTYTPMPGLAAVTVPGCREGCRHEWREYQTSPQTGGDGKTSTLNAKFADDHTFDATGKSSIKSGVVSGSWCALCGGWRGCLGLEPTPEMYVAHLVLVFREVWGVLREDGVLFCNLGDSYASSTKSDNRTPEQRSRTSTLGPKHDGLGGDNAAHVAVSFGTTRMDMGSLKPKDLCGIPWRVAFALQAEGWWLRSDVIWSKPNPMPESVRDRPTKAHEYIFLMTKSERYFWDQEAVREPYPQSTIDRLKYPVADHDVPIEIRQNGWVTTKNRSARKIVPPNPAGRNIRTVWDIATAPYSGAHFACYPPALVRPMVRASTSERGCCPTCGAAWVRVVERTAMVIDRSDRTHEMGRTRSSGTMIEPPTANTLGHRPACDCPGLDGDSPWPQIDMHPDGEANWPTVPCRILDPFVGSGTTLIVARAEGCDGVGLDLSGTYLRDQARKRLELDALDAWENGVQTDDSAPLSELPLFAAGTI